MANRQQTQTPDFIPDTTPDFIPDTTPDVIPDEDQKPSLLHRVLDPANRFASSALSSLGLPTSLSDVPRWGRHMIGQDPGQQPALKELIQAHAEAGKESPVGYVPIIGPASVEMARQNREGNYAGALGTAAGTVAGASPMAGPTADLTSKVKDYAGNTLRNERGAVRPGVKAATKLAQVGLGLGTGGAEGGVTGALMPNLADAFIPNRPPPSFKPITELRPTGAYTDPLAAAGKPDPFGGMTSSRESTWNAELPKATATTPQQPFPRLVEKVKAPAASTAQVEKLSCHANP